MRKDIKVYIASPFFNKEQLRIVSDIECTLSISKIKFYSPRQEGILNDMDHKNKLAKMGGIFKSNIASLEWATHIVAVIDRYDTGTVWEMGYAYKARKKIITFSSDFRKINVMLKESVVTHCVYLDDIPRALLGESIKSKEFKDVT